MVPNIRDAVKAIPVDVAVPTGYVVSIISSFISGTHASPAPPVMAKVTPIAISFSGCCIAAMKQVRARKLIPSMTFNTRTCRLVKFSTNYI